MSNDHTRKVLEQIDEHCKKVGRDTFLSKVQAAAQSALCDFPTEQETQRFNKLGQTYFAQTRAVLEAGLVAPKFDNTMLVAFVNDLSWVVFTSQMIAAMMRDNDTGGGSGKTCVGKCSDEYDKCMNESGCTVPPDAVLRKVRAWRLFTRSAIAVKAACRVQALSAPA